MKANSLIQPSTPSKPAASARGRRLSPLSSLLGSAARARDPTQSYLPLTSSPLAPVTSKGGRRSIRLSSPRATITSSARSGQLNSLISPPASTQSPVLLGSSPSTPAVSTQVPQTQSILPSIPSVIALHSAILPSSTTLPANSVQNTSVPVSSRLASAAIAQDPAIQLSSMTSAAAEASPTRQHGTTLEPTTSVQRASVHLSSPLGQPSLPIVCAGKAQAPLAILPVESVPLAPQGSGSTVGLGEVCLCELFEGWKC